jgi:hypothetical protein
LLDKGNGEGIVNIGLLEIHSEVRSGSKWLRIILNISRLEIFLSTARELIITMNGR